MKRTIIIAITFFACAISIWLFEGYEIEKTRSQIAAFLSSKSEYQGITVHRVGHTGLGVLGTFQSKESVLGLWQAIDSIKAERIFFKPKISYPEQAVELARGLAAPRTANSYNP